MTAVLTSSQLTPAGNATTGVAAPLPYDAPIPRHVAGHAEITGRKQQRVPSARCNHRSTAYPNAARLTRVRTARR